MTSYQSVYDAFLSKLTDYEWEGWTTEERNEDLNALLESAIPWFKFPRVTLERTSDGFTNTLNSEEIQLLATYMKCEWLNRELMSWNNVRPLYDERDFSQANLIDKFQENLKSEKENAAKLEGIYYRAINYRPFAYSQLAEQ